MKNSLGFCKMGQCGNPISEKSANTSAQLSYVKNSLGFSKRGQRGNPISEKSANTSAQLSYVKNFLGFFLQSNADRILIAILPIDMLCFHCLLILKRVNLDF